MMVCRDRDTGPVQPAVCSAAPSAGSIGISFRVMTRIVTSPCLACTMLTSWSMLLVPLLYHRGGLHGSHAPHPQQGRPWVALAGGTLLPHGQRRLLPQARQIPKIVVCAVPKLTFLQEVTLPAQFIRIRRWLKLIYKERLVLL